MLLVTAAVILGFLVLVALLRWIFIDTGMCLDSPDLTGKVAVITGTTSGTGKETAVRLAQLGARVVLCDRDTKKASALAASIGGDVVKCDLSDLSSVKAAAAEIASKHRAVDLLVANAGVMMTPLQPTAQGFELQYGTNHLGHFLLTLLLLPLMLHRGARVVVLSSTAHKWGTAEQLFSAVKVEDYADSKTKYSPIREYGRSKLANALFALELHRRFSPLGVSAFSVHPGVVNTNLGRYVMPSLWQAFKLVTGAFMKTPKQGAQTSLTCALADEKTLAPGKYHADRRPARSSLASTNEDLAARLWDVSVSQVSPFIEWPDTPAAKTCCVTANAPLPSNLQ